MERKRVLAGMLAGAAAAMAAMPDAACAQISAVPVAPVATDAAPPSIEQIELAFASVQGRMTVPVHIGERGPWRFVVDTGAERTVVARELARDLALEPGPSLRVTAMTDTVAVKSALVPDMRIDAIRPDRIVAPLLESADLGALGLIGVDALRDRRVQIDFDKGVMTVLPSRRRRSAPVASVGEIVVRAKSLYGQLIVTNAQWRGKRIAVIVDTGSPMSIGNSALFDLMQRRVPVLGPMAMTSATGGQLAATGYVMRDIGLGEVTFQDLAVAVADVVPFRRFGLEREPALLLGMNALRMFRRVDIDFANRFIRLTLPRALVRGTEFRM